jgi:hypothetical protein
LVSGLRIGKRGNRHLVIQTEAEAGRSFDPY